MTCTHQIIVCPLLILWFLLVRPPPHHIPLIDEKTGQGTMTRGMARTFSQDPGCLASVWNQNDLGQ